MNIKDYLEVIADVDKTVAEVRGKPPVVIHTTCFINQVAFALAQKMIMDDVNVAMMEGIPVIIRKPREII